MPPPGRPIISANDSPTERISQLADHFLQPLLPENRSHLKDTTDFLRKLANLPKLPNSLLVTLDVTSLYTNIPNDEGIEAAVQKLNQHRPGHLKPTNANIGRILDLVLKLNNFQFYDTNYLQIGGTAMGTKVAPSFANIFMAQFEEENVYTQPYQPAFYARFIDDIFLIWQHGQTELDKFVDHLNSCHPTIKFTQESSPELIHFLDTTVHMESDGSIWTDLYTKPTDSHNYLNYQSAHPIHLKRSLPYSQLLRLRRICTHTKDFLKHSGMILFHFDRRGYPRDLLQKALDKALSKSREDLLPDRVHTTTNQPNQPFVLTTQYSPHYTALQETVRKNWDLLTRSSTTKRLAETKIVTGYRRPKNIRDILVKAKISAKKPKTNPPKPNSQTRNCCIRKNCNYCPLLDVSGKIVSHYSGRSYTTKSNVTCKSSNLIYCISCMKCGVQYVGQTKNRLMDRFQGHNQSIKDNDPRSEVARHFNLPSHEGKRDMKIHILDFIFANPNSEMGKALRDTIEFHWIHRLHTVIPMGLNTMDKSPQPHKWTKIWKKFKK